MAIKQVSFDVTENKLRSYVCGTTDKLVDYPTDCDDGSTMVVLDNGGKAIRKLLFDGKSWKYVWHEITANDIVDTEVIPLVDGVCTIDVEYKATKIARVVGASESLEIEFENIPTECNIILDIDCTENAGITLPTIDFGGAPTALPYEPLLGSFDRLSLYTRDGGTTWIGQVLFSTVERDKLCVLPSGIPVFGQKASVTVPSEAITAITADMQFYFNEVLIGTKVTENPDAGEFTDVAGLIVLLNSALEGFTASATTPAGGVVITSDVNGDEGNDYLAQIADVRRSSGGSEVANSILSIQYAEVTAIPVDGTISFVDITAIKVADNADPLLYQFTDSTELSALLNGVTGWSSELDAENTRIIITADEMGDAFNNTPFYILSTYITSGGTDGGVGIEGQVMYFEDNLYLCVDYSVKSGALWKKVTLSDL